MTGHSIEKSDLLRMDDESPETVAYLRQINEQVWNRKHTTQSGDTSDTAKPAQE